MSTDNLTADVFAKILPAGRDRALMRAALRLLAHGTPVTVTELAAAAGVPDLDPAQTPIGADVEYDEAGRIVGWGLTLNPTPHRFSVGGHQLYTWCAPDTLIFPAVIGAPACIESDCPITGTTVRLTIDPVTGVSDLEPATAMVAFVDPDRIPAFEGLARQAAAHRRQEPPPLRRQHRHVQLIGAQVAQEHQLLDLGLHRGRRRLHRAGRQPPQPRHLDRRVDDQQRIQFLTPLRRELARQPVVGLPLRPRASVRDPADHRFRARPDHPRRDQVLTRQPEQQRRRIVLHRPRQQKLIQLLQLHRPRRTPPQILGHQPHMLGPRLRPLAIRTKLRCIDIQLIRQPGHRHRRRRRHLVRHEPQPRQGAQRHRQAQTDRRAPALRSNKRQIRRGQREVPEQLLTTDLRELPQALQLLVREYPRRHEPQPPTRRPTSSADKPSTNHPGPQPEPRNRR